jgi:hypothetical protein
MLVVVECTAKQNAKSQMRKANCKKQKKKRQEPFFAKSHFLIKK